MGTATLCSLSRKAVGLPAILTDAVADVVAAAQKLRADDRLIISPEAVLCELEAIFEAITTLHAVAVRRLSEARNLDATSEVCGRSTKGWLVEDMRLAAPEAGRLMRLAVQLPLHPVTRAAYESAQINAAHAAAILTALAGLPPHLRDTVEPQLVERAEFYPPEEISGFVDELLETLGIDKTSDIRRERRNAQRRVDIGRTLHGHRSVVGNLTPEVGEQVEQALALARTAGGLEDTRTVAQRNHDALGVIAADYLARHQTPSFDGAPRTVIVTIDLGTLENQLRERWLTLPSGATITAETARRPACDAELIPVVLGSNGEVLDIGQADHEFTTPIRRAAYLRDHGRCGFPECRNCVSELHHIVFRRHGGPTSLDNAVWLCAYHHWLAHEGRWTLVRQANGDYLWTSQHGRQRIRHLSTA